MAYIGVVVPIFVQCQQGMAHAITTEESLGMEYDEHTVCDVCRDVSFGTGVASIHHMCSCVICVWRVYLVFVFFSPSLISQAAVDSGLFTRCLASARAFYHVIMYMYVYMYRCGYSGHQFVHVYL